jgi:glycosyltransferase involved in cell wall biosynthesis
VALCTHNGAAHVEEQLRSILSQSPAPFEVIIGDDASTDNTVQIIERTLASLREADGGLDAGVEIVRRTTALGVSANFAATMGACSGELIALSDQDDVWHTGKLAALVGLFTDDKRLVLAHTDARLVDGDGAALGLTLLDALEASPAERTGLVSGAPGDAFAVLVRRNLVTGATVVVRRELLDDAVPFPDNWIHDEWLAVIAAAVGTLRLLPTPLIDYRQHGSNQIGARKPTMSDRWSRLREPRAERALRLSRRASELVDRLERLGSQGRVNVELVEAARAKRDHEVARANLPRWQPARIPAIVIAAARGRYARYSRGAIDILRDAVQPAGRLPEKEA